MHKFYIISYLGQVDIKDVIKSMGGWFNHFPNQYIVCSLLPMEDVKLKLDAVINPGTDKLLILAVDIKNAQGWLPQNGWEWISKHRQKVK